MCHFTLHSNMAWCRIGILLGAMFVWSVTERALLMSGSQQHVNSLWLLVLVVSAVTGTWKGLPPRGCHDAVYSYLHLGPMMCVTIHL